MKLITIVVILGFILFPLKASADTTPDFVIDSFIATYDLNRDKDNVSLLTAQEAFVVKFPFNGGKLTGLQRILPSTYLRNNINLKITSVTDVAGTNIPYSAYKDGSGDEVINIGDPSIKVFGDQSYIIKYQSKGVVNFLGEKQEFYPNFTGRGWKEPFSGVSAVITMPADLGKKLVSNSCIIDTGRCTIERKDTDKTTQVTVRASNELPAGKALSAKLDFAKGTFKPYKAPNTWLKPTLYVVGGVVGLLAVLAATRTAISYIWRDRKSGTAKS